MKEKLCPECGASNPVSEVMCDHCGFPLEGAVAAAVPVVAVDDRCPECGKGVASDMRFCDGCGANLAEARARRDAVIAPPLPTAADLAAVTEPPPVPVAIALPEPAPLAAEPVTAPLPVAAAPVVEPPVVAVAPVVETHVVTPVAPVAPAAPVSSAKPRAWKLACVEGFRLGKEYLLYKEDMLIGRTDAESDIFPELEMTDQDDGFVSRRHARIYTAGEQVAIEDLGGENGTLVDGRPIPAFKRIPLREGQVIRLGKVGLMLKSHGTV